ncbi:DUF3854 domain-containing protein [Floridanema evergladense]|uniref:DUF3854 domain-containing protein n=1 Tax=Floridaenema evergladense BLCC-F167 TaxID=3153639 RepID=A0ABV4WXK4_9CYAN
MESENKSTCETLNPRHIQEIYRRGLPLNWALANCRSVSAQEASYRLGYTAKSDGILLEGIGIQIQFLPDKPWRDDKTKKAPKYRSPLGDYDAILLHHPDDPRFWNDLEALKQKAYKIDGHPCLVITEGVFTGMAINAAGIATIVLLGVEMGLTSSKEDPQKKRYLVPGLENFAKAGFGFIFCFDADAATKPGVRWAQRKLAHQLKAFQVPLYNATGLWQCDESYPNGDKGADDYIQNHGANNFIHEVIGKCTSINLWEKQFEQAETVDWNEPQSYLGTIGYWKTNKDGEITWQPRCNFDFAIERELTSEEGGGFILQLKPEWEQTQYRVLIKATDLTSPDKFTTALSKALGFVVVVSLTKWELNALIAAKQAVYRRHREGQIFRSIDRYGQQSNGLWVLNNAQFTSDGQPTTESDSSTVFDPALGKEDFIPCPIVAEDTGIEGLKRLIAAARIVFGADNINQFLLCCGWVIAGLHFQTILDKEGRFPILNAYGAIGTGKTVALEAALSLVGTNWASLGMISKVTISAVYEHLSKTGSLPVIWDDPPRNGDSTRELDEFCKAMYNAKPRVVRGNRQTPRSPLGFTSNHILGGEHDAAFTRFARVPFYPGGDTVAIPQLKEAMKLASGSFSTLIGIGYHPQEINAICSEFLARLPLAHERIAWNLALVVYYAEKVIELVGGNEQPRIWALDNLTPIENDEENNGNPLTDFVRCIQALEGKDEVGSWDKRLLTDDDGVQWVAIHPASVWSEVQKAFKPATYNQKSLKATLLKIGGIVDRSVRFDASRDEVLAYKRALLTAGYDSEGRLLKPNPPQKKMKKAWLIPIELFGIDSDDTDPPDNPPDNGPGDRPNHPGGDDMPPDAEVVVDSETDEKLNSVSGSNHLIPTVSASHNCEGNQETQKTDLVSSSQDLVSMVSPTETLTNQGFELETASVLPQFHLVSPVSPVSPASGESGLVLEDNTPRAITLKLSDDTLIQLPAEYPGTRGYNQTKEPRQIAKLLAVIQCQADWEAIANQYGQIRAFWVWRWHFNETERTALLEIINGNCGQGNLFDLQS